MQFQNETKWNEFVKANSKGAGLEIIEFAESWANLMEAEIAHGHIVADIAGDALERAQHSKYISGSQFFYGAYLLYATWKHGEALKDWYNARHGIEPGAKGLLEDYIV